MGSLRCHDSEMVGLKRKGMEGIWYIYVGCIGVLTTFSFSIIRSQSQKYMNIFCMHWIFCRGNDEILPFAVANVFE